jgi:3-hydroxyacyl-[acyl-carrier-protein] dehydratase
MRIEYFQLIDRIAELDLARLTIRTEAKVPDSCTIFEGHFPGYPLMPGVLLIESMAQSSGWLVIARTHFEKMPFLAAVKDAKLRTFVRPGQLLTVTANLVHEGSGYAVTEAEVQMAGKPVCSATMTLRVMPFPDPSFRAGMQQVATRLEFPMETMADG